MVSIISALNPWIVAIALNSVLLSLVAIAPKKLLTTAGILHAWFLGVMIWGTLGWRGYLIVVFYFIVGSGVTRIGLAQKEAEGIAEKRSGARGPENVWGSALTALCCAIGVWAIACQDYFTNIIISPFPVCSSAMKLGVPLLLLAYVASFSTKLSDTCASEIGKAYGQRTFSLLTLQPVTRGTEGAVSLEGTLAGVVASIAIAIVGWGVGLITLTDVLICALSAFIATNAESVIGATWQSQYNWLTNEVVNFICTLIGAIAAISLAVLGQSLVN